MYTSIPLCTTHIQSVQLLYDFYSHHGSMMCLSGHEAIVGHMYVGHMYVSS